MGGIEEKIYRRQIFKKGMNLATIDANQNQQESFEKYFKNTDLFELFQFDSENCNDTCETLQLLLKEGCPFEPSPTNLRHIDGYLKSQTSLVKGITLNSNLYTKADESSRNYEEVSEEVSDNEPSCELQMQSSDASTVSKQVKS